MEYTQEQTELLTQAAEHIANLNLQIAALEEEKQQFLAVFKNEDNGMLPRKEPYDFGKVQVKVSENTRLDDALARHYLSGKEYKLVSKTVLDTARARVYLKHDKLKKITKKYDNKIEVKIK